MSSLAGSLIKKNEGFSSNPYSCTAGKLTIGYGTNLEDRGLTELEARYIMSNDINAILLKLNDCGLANVDNPEREAVLIDMAYQMGMTGLFKFKNMLRFYKEKNWSMAAHELLDSKYAMQTPNRAQRNADILRTGLIE